MEKQCERLEETVEQVANRAEQVESTIREAADEVKTVFQRNFFRQLIDAFDIDLSASVEDCREALIRLLEAYGVIEVPLAEGDPFDPTRHGAIATSPAESSRRHLTISDVRGTAFRFIDESQPFHPAKVVVYKHEN